MTKKQDIKQSEARILIYLSVVHPTRKHVTAVSNKLEIDYSYCMRVLQAMTAKGWLRKHQHRRHMYYDLTEAAPLETALKAHLGDELQRKLQTDESTTEEPQRVVQTKKDMPPPISQPKGLPRVDPSEILEESDYDNRP